MADMVHSDTPVPPLLRGLSSGGPWASPDALSALGAFVARNWADDGYRIGLLGWFDSEFLPERGLRDEPHKVLVAEVKASDGSRFMVAVDRYGNTAFLGASAW